MKKSSILVLCGLAISAALLGGSVAALAFSIDFNSFGPIVINKALHNGPAVHESITIEVIRERPGGPANENLIEMIKRGCRTLITRINPKRNIISTMSLQVAEGNSPKASRVSRLISTRQ